jgi:lysophospholipase L1-like esterase
MEGGLSRGNSDDPGREKGTNPPGLTRRLALRGISALVGLILALLLGEALLRLFSLAPTDGLATVTEQDFRSVPGLLSPNQELIDRSKRGLAHHVQVNHLGYRGAPITREKRPGEMRILMAGDSFTYGSYVDDEETLPVQLERELSRSCPGVLAINAGVGGTTIDTQSRLIERALPLRPDLVILTFTENDLDDLAGPSAWDSMAANRAAKSRLPLSILYPVLRRMALWNFGLEIRARMRARSAAAGDAGEEPGTRMLPVYLDGLTALRDRLESQDTRLILALFPSHHSLPKDAPTLLLERVERAGKQAGIPTINLLAALRGSGRPIEALYLLPEDGHPSGQGYQVAASALARQIRRDGWLNASCDRATRSVSAARD